MRRRQFLGRATGMGMAMALGSSFWERALSAPAQPGPSPYGELLPADALGLQLPAGFTSRVVAISLAPVEGTAHVWHAFPDGGACVATEDGGWIYVSNSENPPPADFPVLTTLASVVGPGGAGAIRFDREGTVVDAYPVLTGSTSNCAGGLTPWGTWLSCEEWEDDEPYSAGKVWECDPFGGPAIDRPSLGRFKHEMAAVDPVRRRIYLSEDQPDGLLYRYTPPPGVWGSGAALDGGRMEAMAVAPDGATTWVELTGVEQPTGPLRTSVTGPTPFDGGEGLIYDDGRIYLATKGDDRVWVHDVEAETMAVLYDAEEREAPVLSGVDNLLVSAAHDLYVAEDGDNLEICIVTPELAVAPVVRMTGPQHGFSNPSPVPTTSEVTGLAMSPDGNRLYFSSQRGQGSVLPGPGPGILYEVTGPFRGGTLAAARSPIDPPANAEPPTTTATTPPAPRLPATGGVTPTAAAGALGVAAAAALALRRRVERP